jgi:hypothetical protein
VRFARVKIAQSMGCAPSAIAAGALPWNWRREMNFGTDAA